MKPARSLILSIAFCQPCSTSFRCFQRGVNGVRRCKEPPLPLGIDMSLVTTEMELKLFEERFGHCNVPPMVA